MGNYLSGRFINVLLHPFVTLIRFFEMLFQNLLLGLLGVSLAVILPDIFGVNIRKVSVTSGTCLSVSKIGGVPAWRPFHPPVSHIEIVDNPVQNSFLNGTPFLRIGESRSYYSSGSCWVPKIMAPLQHLTSTTSRRS